MGTRRRRRVDDQKLSSACGIRRLADQRAKVANVLSRSVTCGSAIVTWPRVPRLRAMPSSFNKNGVSGKPLWDSGVRDSLHPAARAEGCDFKGLGPHSFRRANITWRQQVGGTAIEASKIAGHSDLETTCEYSFVSNERQNELTRRMQTKLSDAAAKLRQADGGNKTPSQTPGAPSTLAEAKLATPLLQ